MHPRLDHVGINVHHLQAQTEWYERAFELQSVFEFTLEQVGMSAVVLEHARGWRLELLARNGSAPGLRAADPIAAGLTEGYGHFAVTVAELDPAYARLLAEGAAGIRAPGPSPEPGIRMAWVADPEGNLIELIEKDC